MAKISVVGMDPSLSNWGLCRGIYDTDTGTIRVDDLAIIQPEKTTTKQVRQNSKDLHVAMQLAQGAVGYSYEAQAIFVEVPVGSQSARAMASYGVCVGILGAIRSMGISFFEVTPTEVKLATVGSKTASKKDMIDWAYKAHPFANWPRQSRKNAESPLIVSKAEHMADAVATIHAGIKLTEFQTMIRYTQSFRNTSNANPIEPSRA